MDRAGLQGIAGGIGGTPPADHPVLLRTTPTDAERAADFRARLTPLLEQAADVLSEARRDGFVVGFNIGPDQYGRVRLQSIDVSKVL